MNSTDSVGLNRGLFKVALATIVLSLGVVAQELRAQTIELPKEELAAETVLPVFDNPATVRNRSVTLSRRLEMGVTGGYSMMEPFYNAMSFGGTGTYHFNEEHGVNVTALYQMQGLNANGAGLNPIPGRGGIRANLEFAPQTKYLLLGAHQWSLFYGKISLTKQYVMNLHLYSLLGGGIMGIGDGLFPQLNGGIGTKFYFSPNMAIRLDLRLFVYQGPDVVSRNLESTRSEQPASSFDSKLFISSHGAASAVFLF